MITNKTQRIALYILGLCSVHSINAVTPSKTIILYGLQERDQCRVSHNPNVRYKLQLASFHNRHHADNYREKMTLLTDEPVHIIPSSAPKHVYRVIIGPFSNIEDLNRVRRQLLSKEPLPPHAQHHLKQPSHTTVPLTAKSSALKTNSNPAALGGWKDMANHSYFKTGPYVGASTGPLINITGAPTTYVAMEGTLSAGWGHLWNQRTYLAGEVFGGSSARVRNYPTAGTGFNVRSTWSYGADVLPGLMVNDNVLAYLRAGVIRRRFSGMETERTAWRAGVGGETNIYKDLDIRAEYIYSLYQSIPGIGKPQTNQFNLGLVKKFM